MSQQFPIEAPDILRAAKERINEYRTRLKGHEHDWDIIDTWRPSGPLHPRMGGQIPITIVLAVCKGCHIPSTVQLDGQWNTEQVKGIASGSDSTADRTEASDS